jgi:hypothetical protein
MRLRYEMINGQARAGGNASDDLTSLQTRWRLAWTHGPIQLVTELHDSRAWGANAGTPLTTAEVNALEPVQAYVQADLGQALGRDTKVTVQAGRFTMGLGSRRLIANDEYRNATNGFTGVRADVAGPGGTKATMFYVLPQLRLPDDKASLLSNAVQLDKESFAAVLWGGFLSRQRKGSPLLAETSFVHFGEHNLPGRPTRHRSLNNFSLRLATDPQPGHADWGMEGIYQWGRIDTSLTDATRLKVSATFLRLQAGYSFAGPWKPHVMLELDRASGDGPGSTYGHFDTLFGSRRSDFGPGGLDADIGRANILSPGARIEVTSTRRFDAMFSYRALFLADSHDAFSTTGVRDATGKSGSFAGHQFDLRLRQWLVPKRLRAEVDGVYLAKGRFLQIAPNAPADGDVRYASFNLTATF